MIHTKDATEAFLAFKFLLNHETINRCILSDVNRKNAAETVKNFLESAEQQLDVDERIRRLEQDYQNAVDCNSEDLLAIWDELTTAYKERIDTN